MPDADWTNGLRGKKLYSTYNLENWIVVHTQRDSHLCDSLIRTLQQVAPPLGIQLRPPTR